jgi:hypothetical protein
LYEIQKMVENYQDSLIHKFYEKYPNVWIRKTQRP